MIRLSLLCRSRCKYKYKAAKCKHPWLVSRILFFPYFRYARKPMSSTLHILLLRSDGKTVMQATRTRVSDGRTRVSDDRTHSSEAGTRVSETGTRVSDDRTHLSEARTHLSEARTRSSEAGTRSSEAGTRVSEGRTRSSDSRTRSSDDRTRVSDAKTRSSARAPSAQIKDWPAPAAKRLPPPGRAPATATPAP